MITQKNPCLQPEVSMDESENLIEIANNIYTASLRMEETALAIMETLETLSKLEIFKEETNV